MKTFPKFISFSNNIKNKLKYYGLQCMASNKRILITVGCAHIPIILLFCYMYPEVVNLQRSKAM